MMKVRLPALFITFALLGVLGLAVAASGCGSAATAGSGAELTKEQFSRIETGITAEQLKSIAGEPSRTESKTMGGGHAMDDGDTMGSSMNVEYWYYQGDKGWIRFEVTEGKVTAKSGY